MKDDDQTTGTIDRATRPRKARRVTLALTEAEAETIMEGLDSAIYEAAPYEWRRSGAVIVPDRPHPDDRETAREIRALMRLEAKVSRQIAEQTAATIDRPEAR